MKRGWKPCYNNAITQYYCLVCCNQYLNEKRMETLGRTGLPPQLAPNCVATNTSMKRGWKQYFANPINFAGYNAVATNTSMKRGWKHYKYGLHHQSMAPIHAVATNTSMKRGWKRYRGCFRAITGCNYRCNQYLNEKRMETRY